MRSSVHDCFLRSYEVSNERGEIRLRAEYRHPNTPSERIDVLFAGVEAYHFQYDCLGNILFGLDEVSATDLLLQHRADFEEGFRLSGWPRFWGGSFEHASNYIQKRSVCAYELSSSYGISGWVLARNMTYLSGHTIGD